jgi:hypothetical protein
MVVRFHKKRRHNIQLDIVFLRQGMANPRKDTSRIDVLDAALSPRIQKWPGFEDFQKVTWWFRSSDLSLALEANT